ncbi:unnamed protein product [Dovyalis caffra]|uniref:Uncharacterized protein n=1 Tax=Dovyalis caffra TaxID=77055 RepID=A0AAV1R1R4_9ROSI|nr:unnamed protein product [Dovyalis caffra]
MEMANPRTKRISGLNSCANVALEKRAIPVTRTRTSIIVITSTSKNGDTTDKWASMQQLAGYA